MKLKWQIAILEIVALFCIVIIFNPFTMPISLTSIFSFPFEQISSFLRYLSLSSSFGNILSLILYIIICFSPWIYFLKKKNRTYNLENILMIVLPFILLFIIYQMINPNDLFLHNVISMNNAILGILVYSTIFSFLILKSLRGIQEKNPNKLLNYLSIILFVVNIILVIQIFYAGLITVRQAIIAMESTNSLNNGLFRINQCFIFIRFILDNLPYMLNIIVILFGTKVLQTIQLDGYSSKTIENAQQLSKLCKKFLYIILFSNIGFQFIQLLFGKSLFNVNSEFDFPIFSILLILVCILVVNLIKENKELKEENDRFI